MDHAAAAPLIADPVSAKAEKAKQLLSARPPDFREGVTLLVQAADAGHGEAAYLLSVFAGAGLGLPQNWQTALTFLQRAAERGHAPAQKDLAFLAGERAVRGSDRPMDYWKRLRDKVNLKAWLSPPAPRQVNKSPCAFTVEKFLTPQICDWLIAQARPALEPVLLYGGGRGSSVNPGHGYSGHHFSMIESNLVMVLIQARIAAAAGFKPDALESLGVLCYEPGKESPPHVDFLDPALPANSKQVAQLGQRVVTFFVDLNEGYQGGEIGFPEARWRYKGRKGAALFFWNIDETGAFDPKSRHTELAPNRAEKWLLSQWIRRRPWAS